MPVGINALCLGASCQADTLFGHPTHVMSGIVISLEGRHFSLAHLVSLGPSFLLCFYSSSMARFFVVVTIVGGSGATRYRRITWQRGLAERRVFLYRETRTKK